METFDRLQQRYRPVAFGYAVQKKFSDDRGSYLAALVTYYGFLSIFPLLLASFTVAAYVLAGDHSAIRTVEHHLGSYPIIGPAVVQLEGNSLHGSPWALAVGLLGLVWGAMGLARAAQHSMDEAWNVPGRIRRPFAARLARGLGWYAVFGTGIVASTFVTSLGSAFNWVGGPALSALLALTLNLAVFVASFRILSPPVAKTSDLLPGAMFAGTAWTVLTGVGVGLAHTLAHSNVLYGSFAPVLALLAFLYLAARLTVYGIEANVVRAERLWPRALTKNHPVPADFIQAASLAQREERLPGQTVTVEF